MEQFIVGGLVAGFFWYIGVRDGRKNQIKKQRAAVIKVVDSANKVVAGALKSVLAADMEMTKVKSIITDYRDFPDDADCKAALFKLVEHKDAQS